MKKPKNKSYSQSVPRELNNFDTETGGLRQIGEFEKVSLL